MSPLALLPTAHCRELLTQCFECAHFLHHGRHCGLCWTAHRLAYLERGAEAVRRALADIQPVVPESLRIPAAEERITQAIDVVARFVGSSWMTFAASLPRAVVNAGLARIGNRSLVSKRLLAGVIVVLSTADELLQSETPPDPVWANHLRRGCHYAESALRRETRGVARLRQRRTPLSRETRCGSVIRFAHGW